MKLAVIVLDGLTAQQLSLLGMFSKGIADACRASALVNTRAGVLCNTQATWSTLLTGVDWFQHGCFGFSRPESSLNKSRVFEESLLPAFTLLQNSAPESIALVNVPLVSGENRNRLADPTLPNHRQFSSPSRLCGGLGEASFNEPAFLPWPLVVGADLRRLELCTALLEQLNLSLLLLRLTSFDVLGHLFGAELFGRVATFSSELEQLGAALDALLGDLSHRNFTPVLLSTYSFVPCVAVLSINHLLTAGGFCNIRSVQRMKLSAGELKSHVSGHIDCCNTEAASLAHRTVHVNRADRFADGIVQSSALPGVMADLKSYLPRACAARYELPMQLIVPPEPGGNLPDLVFDVAGATYSFFENARYRPAAVHASPGAVVVPPGMMPEGGNSNISLVDVSRMLTGMILH